MSSYVFMEAGPKTKRALEDAGVTDSGVVLIRLDETCLCGARKTSGLLMRIAVAGAHYNIDAKVCARCKADRQGTVQAIVNEIFGLFSRRGGASA